MAKRRDAIAVLTEDHRTVEDLFKRFEKTTDRAVKTRGDLVERMVRELSIHAAIEEQLLYPRLRLAGEKIKDEVLEGLEEHHVVKELLAEIERMNPEMERFEAKVTVLMENVRHHIEEEEGELFPRARRALTAGELVEIGEGLEALKSMAPTRPHPNAPDEPPGNLANLGVAGVDRARDTAEAAVEATGRVVRKARDAVVHGES
jgi:hemerythrin superfamily protein